MAYIRSAPDYPYGLDRPPMGERGSIYHVIGCRPHEASELAKPNQNFIFQAVFPDRTSPMGSWVVVLKWRH